MRNGTTWSQQQILHQVGIDSEPNDEFGSAVALSADGNTALIGAEKRSDSMGAAYVFVRDGTTWRSQTDPAFVANDGMAGDHFGISVALSADGNTALIGAQTRHSDRGAAYVFVRSGTTWSQQTTPPLLASDGADFDFFGVSVAFSANGNTALIGAFARDGERGAAYVFVRSGTTWTQQTSPPLTASDGMDF